MKLRTCYLLIATCYLLFGCQNPYMARDLQPIVDELNPVPDEPDDPPDPIDDGVVIVTITVEEIKDADITITPFTLSRSGSGVPVTANVSVTEADYDLGSISWEIAGAGAYSGEVVAGTGASFIIDATNVKYNTIGGHSLVVEVRIDGILYRRNILFTIVE